MSVNLHSDQSRQVNWTVREDTDATMTITCTTSAVATDLSTYTFIAEFYKVGGTTHFLQLTQGAGITNNGATGILTIALTDTQLNLTPGEYWWRLRTTAPTDNYWFNGKFIVNGYVWDGSTNSEVSVALTIGQTAINLAITIAAGGGGGGSGTVTSFSAGDLAPLFTTSEATVTTTPALTFAQIVKAANLVFAGPTSGGSANPDFRSLVAADIPNLASVYQPLDADLTAIAALTTTAFGRALLELAAPSAIRFIRINADNTYSQLTAQQAIDAISQMTTLGDTLYGGASGTQTRLAGNISTWRKKKVQTGDGANSAAPAWADDVVPVFLVAGDQTTTSASATNITELLFAMEANSRYIVTGFIHHGCSGAGGTKFAVDVPASASFFVSLQGKTSAATAFLNQHIITDATLHATAFNTGASASGSLVMNGGIQTGATAGNAQFMFASGTGGETSTISQQGTFLLITKIV